MHNSTQLPRSAELIVQPKRGYKRIPQRGQGATAKPGLSKACSDGACINCYKLTCNHYCHKKGSL